MLTTVLSLKSLGVEGLIHVSEMSWSTHLRSAGDFVKIGDEVEAEVLTIDREDRKISLGIKQLTCDPWANIQKIPCRFSAQRYCKKLH